MTDFQKHIIIVLYVIAGVFAFDLLAPILFITVMMVILLVEFGIIKRRDIRQFWEMQKRKWL